MAVRQDSNSPKRIFKLMLRKRYADRFVSDAAVDRDAHQEGRRTPEQGYLAKLPASLNSLRALLSDPATGTPSQTPATDRIGVMPNLRAIIDGQILNLAPDVYLRDFVGDTGDPHSGAISASPDVILRESPEANPQAAFGEGSGSENNTMLGLEAEAGQDNFIYVRVRNRGGSAAANVQATVYWSPPATLVTPVRPSALAAAVVTPEASAIVPARAGYATARTSPTPGSERNARRLVIVPNPSSP